MTSLPTSTTETAAAYLGSLPLELRRQAGQVYPPHLVQFILERAGYAGPRGGSGCLLDPACGAGAFLVAAAEWVALGVTRSGLKLTSGPGRAELLSKLETSLFGVDIDDQAIKLTRQGLGAAIEHWTGSPAPPRFLSRNLVCGDFLNHPGVCDLPPVRNGGFEFIVGNPPYVSSGRLGSKYKEQLRAKFETASGRLDLYTLFMEQALTLLRPGGRFAFITPDKFLTSQTSEPLRLLLQRKGAIRMLARFRSHKVFADAATVPCVTVFERTSMRDRRTEMLACDEKPTARGRVRILRRTHADPSAFSHGAWQLDTPHLRKIANAIQANHPLLAQFASRFSAGLATGRDSLYVLPADSQPDIESDLLKPAIRGRDLLPFRIVDPGLSLLVPYTFDIGKPAIIQLRSYPRAAAYLRGHEALLRYRHCVRAWEKPWFDLHDFVPVDIGRLPKILVPDIANYNRFAFDPGRYWPLHSAYYLVPKGIDPMYLTAVLNSIPIEFLIRLRAPVVKDGFSRYRKQFLEPLPVPQPSALQRKEVVRAVEQGDDDRATQLVTRLFGLSTTELRLANEFLTRAADRRLLA